MQSRRRSVEEPTAQAGSTHLPSGRAMSGRGPERLSFEKQKVALPHPQAGRVAGQRAERLGGAQPSRLHLVPGPSCRGTSRRRLLSLFLSRGTCEPYPGERISAIVELTLLGLRRAKEATWRRSTCSSPGQWYRPGEILIEPYRFVYLPNRYSPGESSDDRRRSQE